MVLPVRGLGATDHRRKDGHGQNNGRHQETKKDRSRRHKRNLSGRATPSLDLPQGVENDSLRIRPPQGEAKKCAWEAIVDLPLHLESIGGLAAPVEAIFAYLDDQRHLGAHMSRSSWMMAGSSMEFVFDAAEGRAVGAKIGLRGKVLGIPLSVDEVVVERTPPTRKAWETVGVPKLLVIGPYRMGFEVKPDGSASRLRVFIDYQLPNNLLGRLFGNAYARWCTTTMVRDAVSHFTRPPMAQ
jgi:hypothetical protein